MKRMWITYLALAVVWAFAGCTFEVHNQHKKGEPYLTQTITIHSQPVCVGSCDVDQDTTTAYHVFPN